MDEGIVIKSDGETAAQALTAILARQGYRVVRSFDLRSALSGHADCKCPYHGTERCTCQYVVLLVYGEAVEPVVVTAHSYDAQTSLRIVADALTHPDSNLAGQVAAAMQEAALTWPAVSLHL